MSEPKDYGEPWSYEQYSQWSRDGRLMAESWNGSDEHGARIVACVNACQGLADPASAIAAARDALESINTARYSSNPNVMTEAIANCVAALSLLTPQRKETT